MIQSVARARLHVQRALERGIPPGPMTRAAASLYAHLVAVERPLHVTLPALCVGGATLGGSGKTPLAIAAASALAERGRRVVLVGHAYGARPGCARFVDPDDDVAVVGDEALEAARVLAGTGTLARVVVAPSRQLAVDLAQRSADVLVLDGPLQLRPQRATLSWLAVDGTEPWGSGSCPPLGDLRAPVSALRAATDAVVECEPTSRGVWRGANLLGWHALRTSRVGLLTAIARPERVVALLKRHGCTPARVLLGPNHGLLPRPDARDVDLWLTTGKDAARSEGFDARIARIDYHLRLPPERLEQLHAGLMAPPCPSAPRF